MNSPKEKAKELYLKYTDVLNIRDLQSTANPFAKECAIITVDEIIKAKTKILDKGDGWQLVESNIYWQEVKQEIENL